MLLDQELERSAKLDLERLGHSGPPIAVALNSAGWHLLENFNWQGKSRQGSVRLGAVWRVVASLSVARLVMRPTGGRFVHARRPFHHAVRSAYPISVLTSTIGSFSATAQAFANAVMPSILPLDRFFESLRFELSLPRSSPSITAFAAHMFSTG